MPERKQISKRTRFDVLKRDKFTCQYCGKSAPDVVLHIDHIVPVSKGGTNDIINLVTSCAECNLGKSNIELSDESAIAKQRKHLEELEERREQLEMMFEWQRELLSDSFNAIDKVDDLVCEITGYNLSESGRKNIGKYIERFGYETVLESARIAFTTYSHGNDAEWEYAFGKIGGICYNRTHKTCRQCVNNDGYDASIHMVKCAFDHGGSYWCKNSYAEHCKYFDPWTDRGDSDATAEDD